MSQITLIYDYKRPIDTEATSLQDFQKRRVMRRRRVAKRLLAKCPLFAVAEMQAEFPGYTIDQFDEDIQRKGKKRKPMRKPKKKGFDWAWIQDAIPEFIYKCKKRSKTQAHLRIRFKEEEYTVVVRSVWFDGQQQQRLFTGALIDLWRGDIRKLLKHPAVLILKEQNTL